MGTTTGGANVLMSLESREREAFGSKLVATAFGIEGEKVVRRITFGLLRRSHLELTPILQLLL